MDGPISVKSISTRYLRKNVTKTKITAYVFASPGRKYKEYGISNSLLQTSKCKFPNLKLKGLMSVPIEQVILLRFHLIKIQIAKNMLRIIPIK